MLGLILIVGCSTFSRPSRKNLSAHHREFSYDMCQQYGK